MTGLAGLGAGDGAVSLQGHNGKILMAFREARNSPWAFVDPTVVPFRRALCLLPAGSPYLPRAQEGMGGFKGPASHVNHERTVLGRVGRVL